MNRTKEDIAKDWLPRYTHRELADFGEYILLTNWTKYVEMFASIYGVEVMGRDVLMPSATANNITIINFGMGSPNAAMIMDMLVAIEPKAVLFLGKCGGLRDKNQIGDLILPIAAIRGEGTSNDYFPPEIPALPAFALQRTTSSAIRDFHKDYWTGTVYTTNRRVWEHDLAFCEYLRSTANAAFVCSSWTPNAATSSSQGVKRSPSASSARATSTHRSLIRRLTSSSTSPPEANNVIFFMEFG